jgi:hypothetical protein
MDFLARFAALAEKWVFLQVAPREQVTVKKKAAGFSLDWKAVRKYDSTTKFWRLRFRRD